jgi:hypothetical protein
VLGAGERLFGETSDKKAMRLVDTQTVGDGVVSLTYERVRDADRASDGATPQDKGASPQPQRGTGACSKTSASGWELCIASLDPHSA